MFYCIIFLILLGVLEQDTRDSFNSAMFCPIKIKKQILVLLYEYDIYKAYVPFFNKYILQVYIFLRIASYIRDNQKGSLSFGTFFSYPNMSWVFFLFKLEIDSSLIQHIPILFLPVSPAHPNQPLLQTHSWLCFPSGRSRLSSNQDTIRQGKILVLRLDKTTQ